MAYLLREITNYRNILQKISVIIPLIETHTTLILKNRSINNTITYLCDYKCVLINVSENYFQISSFLKIAFK